MFLRKEKFLVKITFYIKLEKLPGYTHVNYVSLSGKIIKHAIILRSQ